MVRKNWDMTKPGESRPDEACRSLENVVRLFGWMASVAGRERDSVLYDAPSDRHTTRAGLLEENRMIWSLWKPAIDRAAMAVHAIRDDGPRWGITITDAEKALDELRAMFDDPILPLGRGEMPGDHLLRSAGALAYRKTDHRFWTDWDRVSVLEKSLLVVARGLRRVDELELARGTLDPGMVMRTVGDQFAIQAKGTASPDGEKKVKLPKTRRGLMALAATTARDQRILADLQTGMSYRSVAKRNGVGHSTVGRIAQAYGLTGHTPETVPLEGTLQENLTIRGKPRKQGKR